jgi:hypothetical protein
MAIKASLDKAGIKDYQNYFDPEELEDMMLA